MEKIKTLIQKVADTNFECGDYRAEKDGGSYWERYESSKKAKDQLIEEIEKLAKGLRAVESLIGESEGVAGYHKNGDVATWEELRSGGRCEALSEFDDALELLK